MFSFFKPDQEERADNEQTLKNAEILADAKDSAYVLIDKAFDFKLKHDQVAALVEAMSKMAYAYALVAGKLITHERD